MNSSLFTELTTTEQENLSGGDGKKMYDKKDYKEYKWKFDKKDYKYEWKFYKKGKKDYKKP